MSGSITPVFHQEMLNYRLTPSFEYQVHSSSAGCPEVEPRAGWEREVRIHRKGRDITEHKCAGEQLRELGWFILENRS